ncbi:MAG: hypothetical protein QNJ63_22135 [Calothrix sp. MO_192.B10]|nr:hypothetical protein [Calothrix sp. MO_192.B10]
MNCKTLSQTTGAIANYAKYTLTILAFTSFIIPLSSVRAETTSPNSLHIAQAKPQSKSPEPPLLKLTPQQIEQIQKINQKARAEMQNVLTDKQKREIKTAIESGKPPRQVYASIKLSTQQQLRLQRIFVTSQQEKENVLTDSQKQKLAEYRKKVRQQQLQQQQKK